MFKNQFNFDGNIIWLSRLFTAADDDLKYKDAICEVHYIVRSKRDEKAKYREMKQKPRVEIAIATFNLLLLRYVLLLMIHKANMDLQESLFHVCKQ